ncbi:MAG: DUF2589 domain-containing protein [Prevotellaceae bacterium]|jgi:hypothetical protein|nr:DUF2589 domain-containing protein [Prevotellaceae bacterium]
MENNQVKRASNQVMDLQQLIAGPLMATIDADSISSRRYLDYLFEVAFESYDKATGKAGELRMLSFTYDSQDVNSTQRQSISIPMLTLVPLPLLQVKEAEFDFDIKIVDAVSQTKEEQFSLTGDNANPDDDDAEKGPLKMRASLAPQSGQSKTDSQQGLSANMKIKIKMQQADMPGGLSNLLHVTASNMQVKDVDKKEEAHD